MDAWRPKTCHGCLEWRVYSLAWAHIQFWDNSSGILRIYIYIYMYIYSVYKLLFQYMFWFYLDLADRYCVLYLLKINFKYSRQRSSQTHMVVIAYCTGSCFFLAYKNILKTNFILWHLVVGSWWYGWSRWCIVVKQLDELSCCLVLRSALAMPQCHIVLAGIENL